MPAGEWNFTPLLTADYSHVHVYIEKLYLGMGNQQIFFTDWSACYINSTSYIKPKSKWPRHAYACLLTQADSKGPISLCIQAVWSGPSLSLKNHWILQNVSRKSTGTDDTLHMHKMIWICTFFFCSTWPKCEQQRSWPDFDAVQAGLDLCCLLKPNSILHAHNYNLHYDNGTSQPQIRHFFSTKKSTYILFLILHKTICCGY